MPAEVVAVLFFELALFALRIVFDLWRRDRPER